MTKPESYRLFYEELLRQAGGTWFDFEGLIRDIYVSVLRPGDWAVDVGAHKGDHTFQMAQAVAPHGRVIAIEAVPSLVQRLRDVSSQHYPHLKPIIDFHECGVSHSKAVGSFYFAPEVPGMSGLRYRDVLHGYKVDPLVVQLLTLDSICVAAEGAIRFIKIDIEGAEYDAIQSARRTIEQHQPIIVFEHSASSPQDFGYSIEQMLDLWAQLGYRIYDFFGKLYGSVDVWKDSLVFNFLALPKASKDADRIFAAVHNTLAQANVRYPLQSNMR